MLSDGEYVIKEKAVNRYGVDTFNALNAEKFHKGGPVGHRHGRNLPGSLFKWKSYAENMPDYWSDGTPSGSPYTQRWGALRYGPAKGKDIWGGTEIPGLPFNGKIANRSDYWHQMQEQPRKSSGPGVGLDKYTPPLVGSGASAWSGGLLGGGGGQMFHDGGPVHPHPHDALTNTLIQAPKKGTTAYAKYAYEMAKRGGAAKAAAKLTKLIKTDAGPAYEFLQDGAVGYSRARKYTYEDAGMGSAKEVESKILSDLSKTAMRAKIIEMNGRFAEGGLARYRLPSYEVGS